MVGRFRPKDKKPRAALLSLLSLLLSLLARMRMHRAVWSTVLCGIADTIVLVYQFFVVLYFKKSKSVIRVK